MRSSMNGGRGRKVRDAHVPTGRRCQKCNNNNNNNNNNDDGNYISTYSFFLMDPTAACDRKRAPNNRINRGNFWDDSDGGADYNKQRCLTRVERWLCEDQWELCSIINLECSDLLWSQNKRGWLGAGLENRLVDAVRRACSCDGREKRKN